MGARRAPGAGSRQALGDRRREAGSTAIGGSPSRRGVEVLSAEELDEVIAVAGDISPEWGAALHARRDRDPEGLRHAIQAAGPRLVALATLKRSHPDLYRIRVEDLRLQAELKRLASEYRAAVAAGSTDAKTIEQRLREKVERQVDLDLRASAMELQALDEQLKRMVAQLKAESQQRSQRIESVLEEIKAGAEPKPLVRPRDNDAPDSDAARGTGAPGTAPAKTPRGAGAPPSDR